MLKRYTEAQEPSIAGSITEGRRSGTRNPEMPPTWTASYRELERCLKAMRSERPKQYRHVQHRYIAPESRTEDVDVKKGKLKIPPHCELAAGAANVGESKARVRLLSWPAWVKQVEVDKGVRYLSEQFRGEPFVPAEFMEAA